MRGVVTYAGRGQAGCEVRLCDLATGEVAAVATSDGAGGFTFDVPTPERVLLVARCADEAIGLVGAEPAPGVEEAELAIESTAAVHPVTVAVLSAGAQPAPPDITLALEALLVRGAPELWLAAARVPAGGVTRRWFATPTVVTGGPSALRLQAGRWRVLAQRIGAVTAHAPGLQPQTWGVETATVDGRPAELHDGAFELDLTGPVSIELRIAPRG